MAIHVGSGAKVNVGFQVFGAGQVRIGKGTWVGPNCRIHTAGNYGVTVEENCDIGPEVVFVCGSHELANWERRAGLGKASPIHIYPGCWIGARSTILGGVLIGPSSVIGAGALVNHDIPRDVVAVGIPCKTVRKLD